jgi:hypothetical protein
MASFATSYIPTGASAVTRATDVCSISGSNFSGWYESTQGALHCEYRVPFDSSVSIFPLIAGFSDGTFNNAAIHYTRTVDDGRRATIRSGGSAGFDNSNGSAYTYGQPSKQAFSYAGANFAFSVGGATASVSSSVTWPTVDRLGIANTVFVSGALSPLNGTVGRLTYWRQSFPASTLQTITQ